MIGSILGKSSCDCEAPDSTAEPLPPNLLQRDLGIAGRHWAQGGVAVWAGGATTSTMGRRMTYES